MFSFEKKFWKPFQRGRGLLTFSSRTWKGIILRLPFEIILLT